MANQKLTHTIEWEQIGGNYRIIKLTGSKRQPTLDEAREYLREHHLPEEIWCCGFYNNQEASDGYFDEYEINKTLTLYEYAKYKFVHDLHPENVILLSGTPTGGKYEKLWSQLKLLGWKISEDAFFKNYVVTEWIEDDSGFKIKVIRGYKNVERLKDKLRQHGCIFMKTEEVFDLPEQIEIPIWVEPTKDFKKFMKDDMVILSDGVELIGDTKLTKRLYSRQLCGQYNAEKIAAFKDLLTSTDDRLIVFYNFNEELFKLTEIAVEMERPVSIVNGKTKDLEAYETRDDSITFVQYQAGAMGLNLQKANKVIYFTLPEWSDLYEQSKKRIHRIGQKNNCIYYLMFRKRKCPEPYQADEGQGCSADSGHCRIAGCLGNRKHNRLPYPRSRKGHLRTSCECQRSDG